MTISGPIIDRMRANLAAAGITPSDADLEAIAVSPFIQSVAAFDERSATWSREGEPDYLVPPSVPKPAGPNPNVPSHAEATEPPHGPADSIGLVARRVRGREISPVDLTEQALGRIERRDPMLNAFQHVLAEHALEAARRAEREIAAGNYRGPLHGIPIAIKDLLAQRGFETTAGSRILRGNVAASDAAAVERLEEAGAIIVGRTRMSEFAYLPGSSNAHYGPTRNPWNPERDAGGSSSGSAVAVAEGMAFAALGSDTGGSIRIPAAFCGVVGLKPTFGRISLHGVFPLSWSLDHLGPITRTVGDAALLLGILAGHDPRDARTRAGSEFHCASSPAPDARGMRIGVLADDRLQSKLGTTEVRAAVERALRDLEESGAELVPVELPELEDLWILNNAILAIEAATLHEPWLRERLAEYGEIPRRRLLAAYAHAPGGFVRAQRGRREIRGKLEQRFEAIDLLALPAQPDGAPTLDTPGWTLHTGPFNALGWPAISVPAGSTSEGLPIGLQLVGRPWADAAVLRAAAVVEASR
jgi:Asp-tRNA(Asn)/Glu-tRNA(Gln) amidotransferase A subunit family amidase